MVMAALDSCGARSKHGQISPMPSSTSPSASAPAYGIPPEVMQVLWRVQAEFLDAALYAVDTDHGGVDAYLQRELGLSPVALRQLGTLYLQR